MLAYFQGQEGDGRGGEGVLILYSDSSFSAWILHPTFSSYRYTTSCAQIWWITLPRICQIPNPAPFFSEIPDPENTLPDPLL